MKLRFVALLACLAGPALAQTPLQTAPQTTLDPADEKAAFTAAGFIQRDGKWVACVDDPSESYTPGRIEQVVDLNGDGRPEAVTSEGTSYCYGYPGVGYSVVSKQANGSWKLMSSGTGMPSFLKTKGVGGWPDLEVGGPGLCFPVLRWNGTAYVFNRNEYEGKRCTPQD